MGGREWRVCRLTRMEVLVELVVKWDLVLLVTVTFLISIIVIVFPVLYHIAWRV